MTTKVLNGHEKQERRPIIQRMKKSLLFIAMAVPLLLVSCGQAGATSAPTTEGDAEVFAKFEDELEDLRQKLKIPGFSAAIVQAQELVWAKGFGYADVENKVEATPDTPYRLASVTKPVAATLIMQLVEEGVLDLDDPISRYGVDLESPGVIQVWHLLTHTSEGIPGMHHNYNGDRYALLNDVIEGASGKSFRELINERILEPLDMTNTAPSCPSCDWEGYIVSLEPDDSERNNAHVYRELAKPYQFDRAYNIVEGAYQTHFSTAAGLISTVVDLAKFDIALDRNVIISQEAKEQMFAPTISIDGAECAYGLGWKLQRYKDTHLIWHGGRWEPSISALYLKVPDENLTFIILANTDNLSSPYQQAIGSGDVLYSTVALAFYKTFVFPLQCEQTVPDIDWEADESDLVSQLKQVTEEDVREILERELWSYRQLFASVGRTELVNRLFDVHKQAYPGSRVNSLDSYRYRATEQFPPVAERIELDETELGRFVGQYVLSHWTVEAGTVPSEVSVELNHGKLIAVVPDEPCLILVPLTPTRFRIVLKLGLYVQFDMDGDVVESVTLEAGDTIAAVYRLEE